jgi:hypothetical protein
MHTFRELCRSWGFNIDGYEESYLLRQSTAYAKVHLCFEGTSCLRNISWLHGVVSRKIELFIYGTGLMFQHFDWVTTVLQSWDFKTNHLNKEAYRIYFCSWTTSVVVLASISSIDKYFPQENMTKIIAGFSINILKHSGNYNMAQINYLINKMQFKYVINFFITYLVHNYLSKWDPPCSVHNSKCCDAF